MRVSAVLITYNSGKFVIEMLESIRLQSYKDIELIISDDCSGDDTVKICEDWLEKNKDRFSRTKLLTVKKNTGSASNANRGLAAAKGEWIKFCAGDDALKENCIKDNIDWIQAHNDVQILFSRLEIYNGTFDKANLVEITPSLPYSKEGILSELRSAESQYRMLLVSDRIHYTPSSFIRRDTLLSVNGFDERFKLLEDYPLWLNLTRNGHKLHFMEAVTVNYRMHSKAVNNTGADYLVNPNFFRQEDFRKLYTYPYLPKDIRLNSRFIWIMSSIYNSKRINKNTLFNRFILRVLTSYLNPFKYYIWLKLKLNRSLKQNEFYL